LSLRNAALRALTSASRVARPVRRCETLQILRRSAVAQRLQRRVHRLRGGGERRVALQRYLHPLADEIILVDQILRESAEYDRERRHGRDGFQFSAGFQPDQKQPIDAGGLIGLEPRNRVVETRDRYRAGAPQDDQ
jgi:hypothetical protein